MSSHLWKYYLEDDVDRFRHLLATASYNARGSAQKGGAGGQNMSGPAALGSPGLLATSPSMSNKKAKMAGLGPQSTPGSGSGAMSLTRADINWRDQNGLTILHHAASSLSETALDFAQAFIDHPLTDLYLQDYENGWTALHRAFYFGNITIARVILERDADNVLGRAFAGGPQKALGLIKIKDHEGLGPLDLYASTIQDRTLRPDQIKRSRSHSHTDSEPDIRGDDDNDDDDNEGRSGEAIVTLDLAGDECFTFGSNRNNTLGFGDEDDRQYPERITLRRPDHLLHRFYREHMSSRNPASDLDSETLLGRQNLPVTSLPWVVRSRPLIVQDVRMSKLHTAVLTTDPESNLYICGHGPGGRLGLGHERTQFHFACVGGALSGKKVATVALSQSHTLALSQEGEIFSWGSNAFGQLGYALPKSNLIEEDPIQNQPRQIFGPLKRETVLGIASSRTHSVAFTHSSLFTWGKNDGQLGLVDSDARSLETQVVPRKVAASLFSTPIASVSAIERATICLLSSTHECWVFANYGYAKIQFPLDGFSNYYLKRSTYATRYEQELNHIIQVECGGDTICALSGTGEVYSLSVSQPSAMQAANASTTNPSKIRGSLSQPHRIWSLKKNNMAARDVGVDADGSIILSTEEGSVWKRSRRAKIKDASASSAVEYKPKDYKFSRISGLTRVVAVRASGYGAYAAVRRDCDVTKTQIAVEGRTLWTNVFPLLPFASLVAQNEVSDSESESPELRFWRGRGKTDDVLLLKRRLLQSKNLVKELQELIDQDRMKDESTYDAFVGSTVSDLRIPIHQCFLAARSQLLRQELFYLREGIQFSIPDLLDCTKDDAGYPVLTFRAMDELSLVNFVLYCYTDNIVDYWHHTRLEPSMAPRYRQIRTELMRIASGLKMQKMEAAVRQTIDPPKSLDIDMAMAVKDPQFFEGGDVVVQLADDEMPVHSSIVCQRCPFFEGLFMGRAGGRWLEERRTMLSEPDEAITVDLKHIDSRIFRMVMDHIYADTGEEMFDDVVCADLDGFIDEAMAVMGVADELMLDRLSQICQKVIGRYVNTRNVCSLINAIAPGSVTEFKDAGLEYMCISLEAMLHGGLLDELDEDLLSALDEVVRQNQMDYLPLSRGRRRDALLHERHPDLQARLDQNKQAKIDSIVLHSRHHGVDNWISSSYRGQSYDEDTASPSMLKSRRKSSKEVHSGAPSPALHGKAAVQELGSSIVEESAFDLGTPAIKLPSLEGGDDAAQSGGLGTPSPAAKARDDALTKKLWPDLASPSSPGLAGTDDLGSSSPLPSQAFASSTPWASATSPGQKLGMKDIMAQASSSRVSSLTQGITASRQKAAADTQAAGKMSQKERKKLQQQHQVLSSDSPPQAQSESPSSKELPWQVASGRKVPGLAAIIGSEAAQSTAAPKPETLRTSSTPHLTMRQTVANAKSAASSPKSIIGPAGSQHAAATPQRAVSGPLGQDKPPVSPSLRPSPSPRHTSMASGSGTVRHMSAANTSSSAPKPLTTSASDFPSLMHSIKHQTPRPVEPSLQLSMSDIVAQQQIEKDIIREATAKRSLTDIQTEQEFQQWWEKESRRAQGLPSLNDEDEDSGDDSKKEVAKKGERGARGARRGEGSSRGGGGARRGGMKKERGGGNAPQGLRRASGEVTGGSGRGRAGGGLARGRGQ